MGAFRSRISPRTHTGPVAELPTQRPLDAAPDLDDGERAVVGEQGGFADDHLDDRTATREPNLPRRRARSGCVRGRFGVGGRLRRGCHGDRARGARDRHAARRLGAGHRRLPRHRRRARARRDREPDVGARPARRPRRARGRGRRAGRHRGHPHPPRPRRRRRRRRRGLPEGHRLRPREGRPAPRRPDQARRTARRWSTATCSTRSTAGSRPPTRSRVRVLEDGEVVESAAAARSPPIDSPGHAKHHLAVHDSESGVLFAGDAVGVRLPDAGRAPPGDAAARLRSRPGARRRCTVRRRAARPASPWPTTGWCPTRSTRSTRPRRCCAAGPGWPRTAWREGHDIAAALAAAFGHELDAVDPEHREKLETLNGIHSNAAGFRRWLDQRHGHTHDRGVDTHHHEHRLDHDH